MSRSLPVADERRGLSLDAAALAIIPTEGAVPRFGGHAAVFNSRTAIGNPLTWGFYEEIAPGAFTKTISEGDARMLIDHDSSKVVARRSAGTLRLTQDVRGLAVDADLDSELSYVNDLKINLRNGNITGMSFGFRVPAGKDTWTTETITRDDGQHEVEVRRVNEIQLLEVSPVTFPAYEETDAGLRALRSRYAAGGERVRSLIERYKPEWLLMLEDRGDDPELPEWLTRKLDLRYKIKDKVRVVERAHADAVVLVATATAGAEPVEDNADELGIEERDPKKPYGDVTYADPGYQKDGKKRSPIDTEEHAKAAWSYINKASNAALYTAEQLASIKDKIQAALKRFGVQVSDDDADDKNSDQPGETTGQGHQPAPTEPAVTTRHMALEMAEARMRALSVALRLPK